MTVPDTSTQYVSATCFVDRVCRSSFEAIDKWRDEFLHQAQPRDPDTFPFVLMGNKIDNQADRKVASRSVPRRDTRGRKMYCGDYYLTCRVVHR